MKLFLQTVLAQKNDPTKLLEEVVNDNTVEGVRIQEVKWKWIREVLNELVAGEKGLIPNYIQWAIYFALIIAMILIIYNGVVIITAQGDEGKLNSAKTRLMALLAGVVLLFAFPTLIRIVVSLISNL